MLALTRGDRLQSVKAFIKFSLYLLAEDLLNYISVVHKYSHSFILQATPLQRQTRHYLPI